MHSLHRVLAPFAIAMCCLVTAPAMAARHHHRDERAYGAEGTYRVGGYGDRIYPPAYDGARAYYGGRHDNRWRWTDTAPYRGNSNDDPWPSRFDSPAMPFISGGVPLPYSGFGARW